MPTFQAYCGRCGKTVTAHTILDGDDLKTALHNNSDMAVTHTDRESGMDHLWHLDEQQNETLSRANY